ncbi:hypothetical protein WH7805_01967 [Synechococcus sp. WH 7805]|nr:hypothetical protein WH7805_01967 [Synechococcus sp. WH 7805]
MKASNPSEEGFFYAQAWAIHLQAGITQPTLIGDVRGIGFEFSVLTFPLTGRHGQEHPSIGELDHSLHHIKQASIGCDRDQWLKRRIGMPTDKGSAAGMTPM